MENKMKYVYMLRAGQSHYKVGVASNVYNRIRNIQTSNPEKVVIVTTNLVNDYRLLESKLHKWLSDYKTNGGREWFKLSPTQALELSIKINEATTAELGDDLTLNSIDRKQDKIIELLKLTKESPRVPSPIKEIEEDILYDEALNVIRQSGKASTSMLQREFRIGYARASRIIGKMEEEGIISELDGIHRKVLV